MSLIDETGNRKSGILKSTFFGNYCYELRVKKFSKTYLKVK